jgi:hypothetical protein
VVDEKRVDREGESDRREPKAVQGSDPDLLARHVEPPDHRNGRAPPQRVDPLEGEERREDEDAGSAHERSEEVGTAARSVGPKADGEQDRGKDGDGDDVAREQGRACSARQENGGWNRREGHSATSPSSSKRAS